MCQRYNRKPHGRFGRGAKEGFSLRTGRAPLGRSVDRQSVELDPRWGRAFTTYKSASVARPGHDLRGGSQMEAELLERTRSGKAEGWQKPGPGQTSKQHA